MTDFRPKWNHWRVVDGVVIWDCLVRPDAVVIEDGAYVAQRGVDTPDGGQSWVSEGRFSTATAAMLHLDYLAESK